MNLDFERCLDLQVQVPDVLKQLVLQTFLGGDTLIWVELQHLFQKVNKVLSKTFELLFKLFALEFDAALDKLKVVFAALLLEVIVIVLFLWPQKLKNSN